MEDTLISNSVPASGRRVIVAAEVLPETAARHIARIVEQAVNDRGWATVMLAGGTTPRAVYRRLAGHRLPWDRVEIFFGDERAVPPGDPQSNYRMARESLLNVVRIPPAQVHRLSAECSDRETAAREYAARLPDRLDLIVLGIGEDGHTASLFPGSSALKEKTRKVVVVEGSKAPRLRLTITPPVIAAAVTRIVLASGSGKSAAVARALEGPADPVACPAQLARAGIWIMDHAAASALHEKPV